MSTQGAALQVRVRKGRLADLDQIREFTHDTFSWGDYLPAAWASWVRSRRGVLLVAVIGSQIVGTCHLRLLEHREGWLEGLRVRHALRKQGIASILIQAIHAHARQNDCRVIRLETASHNLGAQHAFEKHGYHFLVPYTGYASDVRKGELTAVRVARASDLGDCWALWQKSWVKRATQTVVPAPYGWRWWELTRVRLAAEIQSGRVWIANNAFMTLRTEEDSYDIILLVGNKRGAAKLLDAARVLAQKQGLSKAFWVAPNVPHSARWAVDAGYALDEDGLLIYACTL